MKTLKTLFTVVLSLALCVMMFSACQPSKPNSQSGSDTTTATTTTKVTTTTTTTAPTPTFDINRDLLSEIGMSFAQVREKHGDVTVMWGGNGPVVELADGSGRYVFQGGFDAIGEWVSSDQHGERGEMLLDTIPQPKPDAVIKALTAVKASVIFPGLTETMSGEQLAALYDGLEFTGTVPAERTMEGYNLCRFYFEDLRISIITDEKFMITTDSIVYWITTKGSATFTEATK